MAKLIKGDGNSYNIITDDDVIVVTSPSNMGKTIGEVLVEQQSDINRLKGNVKYIYAYGGVGGSGSGGSGSTEKPINVLITLNGATVSNGSKPIILDGRGVYKLYVKVDNASGKNLFMGYTTDGSSVTDDLIGYSINGENRYKREIDVELNSNGVLNIEIIDDEGNTIMYCSQEYIVDSDLFTVSLNYTDINGDIKSYPSEPYECFVTDPNKKNRYIKIDYSIFLTEYDKESVEIKCEIEGVGEIYSGSEKKDIPIEGNDCEVFINGEPILRNENMGIYTLKATLSYIISGRKVVRTRSFSFSIVPSDLYINVRTAGDVLYDDIDLLINDIINGKDGIPQKYITQGSSLMLYCKVFEGLMSELPSNYRVTYTPYNGVVNGDSDSDIDSDSYYEIEWNTNGLNVNISEDLVEQRESNKGVSVTFPTGGIKRIRITTKSAKGSGASIDKHFDKFVYVKTFTSSCDWFDDSIHNFEVDSYFRANQGDKSYSKNDEGEYTFPLLSSGDGVLSLTSSSTPIELTHDNWNIGITGNVCTVISLGIQVSDINSENAKIVDIYTTSSKIDAKYPLRTTRLFTDVNSEINKIAIPTEVLNKDDNSKYHLVQIIRNLSDISGEKPIFEDYLYIDGMIESVDRTTSSISSVVDRIVLNNINICYNLINVQYFSPVREDKNTGVKTKFDPDRYAYQYWLSYKEKYVRSNYAERLTNKEIFIKNNMHRMLFDGTNVVVDSGIIIDIAKISELPTVVFSYNCDNGTEKILSQFMEMMWAGRANGDSSDFGKRMIDFYWIPPGVGVDSTMDKFIVNIPNNLTDNTNNQTIQSFWEIDLQGTSTMRNRIKNYSLRINSSSSDNNVSKILFSPKFNIDFDPKNEQSFLPDLEWTIKADIADSAHANNTSIGRFVNTVCTKIDTNIPDVTPDASKFIKNTLEGIPVLLYFMCKGKDEDGITDITKVYYFGVYNFNLGRNSYYNLGYTGGTVDTEGVRSDFMNVFYNLKDKTNSKYYKDSVTGFTFAVGEGKLSPNITVAEIQDNYPEFDFHQFDETLLFKKTNGNNACMFGSSNKITTVDINMSQSALQSLVKGVARAGKFCFEQSGRSNDFITSREFERDKDGNPVLDGNGKIKYGKGCVNRYDEKKIPHPEWQKKYSDISDDDGTNVVWYQSDENFNSVNEIDLKNLITTYMVGEIPNKPILNFTSASEYYTICMAFGMVDSVLKNMNLKNFKSEVEGYNFNCAFYDMDCALEEANDGEEKISYLAATDYWYSRKTDNNKISEIVKENDYWNSIEGGKGFDFTSSYLFAVVKYAKPYFQSLPDTEEKYVSNLYHYPQNFWAFLRRSNGELKSAEYFINKYFKSGILSTSEYLSTLNYRVKYLYHGNTFDSEDNVIEQYLANASAFNGSRRIKVKNWLTKRLRFMDLMMNVNDLEVPVYNDRKFLIPGPGDADYKSGLSSNNDITILHSAFDSNQFNTALSSFSGEVSIYAPKHTPFIFRTGSEHAQLYLLTGGIDEPNLITLSNITSDIAARFYGSGMFYSVDKIESMFTRYKSIISDNIDKITYGGSKVNIHNEGFTIDAKSVREIKLDIKNMGGPLSISNKSISLTSINISNSGFYGTFINFPNLQYVNISGVNSPNNSIEVSGSDHLTGEKFIISGSDGSHKTTLNALKISGVTGNFNCINTNIVNIDIKNPSKWDDEDSDYLFESNFDTSLLSEFSISGDDKLTTLSLEGFRKVSITSCNNLSRLLLDASLEEIYIDLRKGNNNEVSKLKRISLGSTVEDGVFDFSNYPNLKRVTLKNCDQLRYVKLPDHDIETYGMSDNVNLMWIDTGSLPAFNDDKSYELSNESIIKYGISKYKIIPSYTSGPKLILCSGECFKNCPNYNMLRRDYNGIKTNEGFKNWKDIDSRFSGLKAYTNIKVSEICTSLENTFYISNLSSGSGDYDNGVFDMDTAIRFIETCVPRNVKENITSLSGCFYRRKNVSYTRVYAQKEKYTSAINHPRLGEYTSLNDISYMYYDTGVNFVSKNLLDLPSGNNKPENELNWKDFIGGMSQQMSVSSDALDNISYRLKSYSSLCFTIYKYVGDDKSGEYKIAGEEIISQDGEKVINYFDICEFFYHITENDKIKAFEDITSISSLNFGNQYIDFSGMFNLFPNVQSLSSFLNNNLGKYNIEGLLYPCKKLTSISNSFCDVNGRIDLYNFFDWGNKDIANVTELFEGSDYSTVNGFTVSKYVTYDNFKKILAAVEKCTKLTRLTNLFSNCLITGYKDAEEKEITFTNTLYNITNISNLFENCTSDYIPFVDVNTNSDQYPKGIYKGGVLNIGRTFFTKLPNFTVAQRTFANTYLSSPLTYDYFCKRGEMPDENLAETVYLNQDRTIEGKLFECNYKRVITNLKECFYNTKFVNCKNWFDDNTSFDRNYVLENGAKHDETGYVYYKYNNQTGVIETHMLDNDILDDCLDNYTDFVKDNTILNNNQMRKWSNHDLNQDFKYYGNIKDGIRPFNPENTSDNTIQQTYCCLPPDFLYGCSDGDEVKLDNLFANSNIIGVIPRNLTKKVRNKNLSNIFKNVNIMPNLEYYYNSGDVSENKLSNGLGGILEKIEIKVDIADNSDSDSDNDVINEHYCVVFRDVDGRLKKRKPIKSDRNLGQFVYVPANYTTSGSLVNIFNFRYNLPKHWVMPSKPDNVDVEKYKTTYEFDEAIKTGKLTNDHLAYHTQYYFTTDRSVKWDEVFDARSVFITSNQDIDFSNEYALGVERRYYSEVGDKGGKYINAWTIDNDISTVQKWINNVSNFHIDLNLCGKKNDYNMIEDYGCPFVNIKDRSILLGNFVSDVLTIFLNGRVFYDPFVVNDLRTSNHGGGGTIVIGYYGFGRNIILPKFLSSPLDKNFTFIPMNNNSLYYDFMVNGSEHERQTSITNYKVLAEKIISNPDSLFQQGDKYKFT